MKRILVFNTDNEYIEDRIEQDDYQPTANEYSAKLDENISFYSPILVGGEIKEGLSQDEIDVFNNQPKQPTVYERISAIEELLLTII